MVNPAIAGNTAVAFEALLQVLAGKSQPAALRTWAIIMFQAHAQGRDLTDADLKQVVELAASLGVAAVPPEPPAPPPPPEPPPPEVALPPPEQPLAVSLRNAAAYYARTGDGSFLDDLVAAAVAAADVKEPSDVQPAEPGTKSSGATPAVLVVTAPDEPASEPVPGAVPGDRN